jgi:6-phosphofructokinase 2
MPGPTLGAAEWRACLDAVRDLSPAWVVGSGSLPPDAPPDLFGQLSELARSLGAQYVVDTSGEPLRVALDAGVYLAKPNLKELGQLIGRENLSVAEAARAARQVVAQGRAEALVVSMAADGVLVVNTDGAFWAAPPPVRVLSTVGAGDCTVAGIVSRLAGGAPLCEAAAFGVAAGTAAVLAEGTQLCRPEDIERLLPMVRVEQVGDAPA